LTVLLVSRASTTSPYAGRVPVAPGAARPIGGQDVGMAIQRMVVGTDGSVPAQRAVEWAAEVAAAVGAEVVAVHVMGMLEDLGDGTKVPAESVRDEVAVRLETEWC